MLLMYVPTLLYVLPFWCASRETVVLLSTSVVCIDLIIITDPFRYALRQTVIMLLTYVSAVLCAFPFWYALIERDSHYTLDVCIYPFICIALLACIERDSSFAVDECSVLILQ